METLTEQFNYDKIIFIFVFMKNDWFFKANVNGKLSIIGIDLNTRQEI